MTPEALRRQTSRHEAGHAAAAILLGLEVESVEVAGLDEHDPADQRHRRVGLTHTADAVDPADLDDLRRRLTVVLAPMLMEGDAPGWPIPSEAPPGSDARHVALLAKALGLDHGGYLRVVAETLDLTLRDDYRRLRDDLAHLAEQRGYLDANAVTVAAYLTESEGNNMHRKRFETTDVDVLGEGELLGFASTFGNVDRVGDRVIQGTFRESVAAIKSGKRVPLVWQHDYAGSPQNWVGRVTDAQETDEGLIIRAEFDLTDPAGRKAWKLARDGDVRSLSIGYSVPRGGSRRGNDGANELHRVDLHEVSVVLVPANEQARILAVKGDDDRDDLERDDDLDRIRQEGADLIAAAFAYADAAEPVDRDAELREKSAAYIAEHAPVRIQVFDA